MNGTTNCTDNGECLPKYQTLLAKYSHKIARQNKTLLRVSIGENRFSVAKGSAAIYNRSEQGIMGHFGMSQEDVAHFGSDSRRNKQANSMKNDEEVGHGPRSQVVFHSAEVK